MTIIRPNVGQQPSPQSAEAIGLGPPTLSATLYPGCPIGGLHECPHFPTQAGYLLIHLKGKFATELVRVAAATREVERSETAAREPVSPAEEAENRR